MKVVMTVLIVVLLLIATALLLPVVFSSPSKQSASLTCLRQTKQVGIALVMYAQDYDERLPPAEKWMTVTLPYTKDAKLYRCPTVHQADEKAVASDAMDTRLSGKSLAKLSDLTSVLLAYESTRNDWDATDPAQTFAPRHNGHGNVIFADGHAKLLKHETFATTAKK